MAIFLALFSSGLWGSADFEGGRLSKRFPAIAVTGASQVMGLALGVVVVIVTGAWRTPAFGQNGYLISGVLAGAAGYIGLICLYAGLATGRMGVVSPISSLCAIVPVTIALAGGEHLSYLQAVGIAVALAGAFCASGPEITGGVSLRPLLLAIGAASGFGTALTFMARGSVSSALMTMVMMRVTTAAISGTLALKFRTMGGFTRRDLGSLAYIGIADFSANLFVGIASTHGLVSVVMVLGSLFPIMTALLAFKILHERLHRVQYVGIVLAVAGVAIISAA
ncbi:MAG: DMT family transporter [Actinomycetota bacterium]